MRAVVHIGVALTFIVGVANAQGGAGWTMWKGGPDRTGVSEGSAPPPMRLLWRFSTEDNRLRYTSPLVADGRVFFCTQRTAYCLEDETGAEIWRYEMGSEQRATPAYHDGVLYVGNPDRSLYALDAATGAQLWAYPAGGPIASSPVIKDGRIYFGADDAHVYALSLKGGADERGQLVWRARLPRSMEGSPAVDDEHLYAVCGDKSVYALKLEDGSIRWKSQGRVGNATSPALAGDNVLVGAGQYLHAFRTRSGGQAWRSEVPDRGSIANSPVVKDDLAYCGTNDGRLVAFETDRGRVKWQTRLEDKIRLESTPTIGEKCLWIGSSKGFVFAVALEDGAPLWKYRIHDFIHTEDESGDTTRNTNRVGGGDQDDDEVEIFYNVLSSPVVIGDRMYVQGDDGTVYRFGAAVVDEYGPELKSAEVHVPAMDVRRRVRISLDPVDGEDPVVEINGQPPIKMEATIVDEGSGINSSTFEVLLRGQKREATWEAEKSLLTIVLADLPKRTGAPLQNLPDGIYQVDISVADWAGNRATHTKYLVVNNNSARPRLEKRESTSGGRGGRGGRGGGDVGGGGRDDMF